MRKSEQILIKLINSIGGNYAIDLAKKVVMLQNDYDMMCRQGEHTIERYCNAIGCKECCLKDTVNCATETDSKAREVEEALNLILEELENGI